MIKITLIAALAIISVKCTRIGVYISKPLCLAEALDKTGMDNRRFFYDDYDCKPLESTTQMKKMWQTYVWCSGDYNKGTCDSNIASMSNRSTFGNFEFNVARRCVNSITTKDVRECGLELVNCFLPRVARCTGF